MPPRTTYPPINVPLTSSAFGTGSVGAAALADGGVGTADLADGILSADATGRAKMADGFVTAAKIAAAAMKRYWTGVIAAGALGASTTYMAPGFSLHGGATSPTSTAANAQVPIPNAMTLKGFHVRTGDAVPAAANSMRLCVQVNGVDTALDVTVDNASAATTTYSDVADVAVAANDRLSIKMVLVGGSGTGKTLMYNLEWEPA